MTVEALKGIEGVTSREAERSKNFFALGLMSWLYNRPTEGTLDVHRARSSRKRPEIAQANATRVQGRLRVRRDVRGLRRLVRGRARRSSRPARYRQITGNTALAYGLIAASKL